MFKKYLAQQSSSLLEDKPSSNSCLQEVGRPSMATESSESDVHITARDLADMILGSKPSNVSTPLA